MKPLKTIQLGSHKVGAGLAPLFLPDIGTFFNQDIAKAESMVRGLHQAGVKVVKGEILHSADIALELDYNETYLDHNDQPIKENYRQLIERKVVTLEDYGRIFDLCHSLGMEIIVSVYDEVGVDFAISHNVVALKIASSNITHKPLIEYICEQSVPLILDTGKACFSEIAQAVEWIRAMGKKELIIQHSPKAPPADVSEQNLRFLETLADAFNTLVGLSDHHCGNEMLWAATVLDAAILEKGLYMDGDPADQGVKHAIALSEVDGVLNTINLMHAALGTGAIPVDVKKHPARMGVVAARNIAPGEEIHREDVYFAFPKLGAGPEDWDLIAGKRAQRPIEANSPVQHYDIID